MGILQNILNVLSPAVASDSDNVHHNTQQVQQPRKKNAQEDEQEKKDRRAFRIAVGTSLSTIAVTAKEEAIAREEDKVNKYRVLAMDAEDNGNERKRKYYEDLADHHGNCVAEYLEEIALMKSNKE
jgi:alkanesulfonate monooxygenase SsuD/methylene tetrahydromethanopterin reductase-like flavin-dependent oxidoreductase (luciferase family)